MWWERATTSREFNGCLNGVYTNNDINGTICNEIARKITNEPGIEGEYVCSYIEKDYELKEATLKIGPYSDVLTKIYKFEWFDGGKLIFDGLGFIMNEKQVAVYYKAMD